RQPTAPANWPTARGRASSASCPWSDTSSPTISTALPTASRWPCTSGRNAHSRMCGSPGVSRQELSNGSGGRFLPGVKNCLDTDPAKPDSQLFSPAIGGSKPGEACHFFGMNEHVGQRPIVKGEGDAELAIRQVVFPGARLGPKFGHHAL